MGPKRKTLEQNENKQEKNPELDHELFLQAFEKPTQIYRYLRTRSIVLPVFLPRTLSYMKHRRSVPNNKRKTFKVDSLLERVETKTEKFPSKQRLKTQESLKLSFSGFHIAEFATEAEYADIEVLLVRMCHKRRKDSTLPVVPQCLGKLQVPVNPKSGRVYPTQEIEIPKESLAQKNGHVVRSHLLLFRVQCSTLREVSVCNGDMHSPSEPPIKRRRNGRISSLEEEVLTFCRELVVFDKSRRCLLTPGQYELGVQTDDGTEKLKLAKVWEAFNGKNVYPLELCSDYPTLKFNLSWGDESETSHKKLDMAELSPSRVPPPRWDLLEGKSDFSSALEQWLKSEYVCPKQRGNGTGVDNHLSSSSPNRKRLRVFYQFSHNDSTHQETEARQDLRCPWCGLACQQLYSLLKHLRLCHSRFNFLYIPHPKGARIDVSINTRYDGSYVGNPQDVHSHVGYAFNRSSPVRRTPVTHVIVYRPQRLPPSLVEFQETESETNFTRQLIQGHNRLYYHTVTCQPVRPQELDTEGRDEARPPWLKQKTVMMIDEFTDVNQGEKELMKIWNLHMMNKEYIGDCMVPQACFTFVEEHGVEIISKQLCRNFLLHLVNLFDFGLIRPDVVQRLYALLETLRHNMATS